MSRFMSPHPLRLSIIVLVYEQINNEALYASCRNGDVKQVAELIKVPHLSVNYQKPSGRKVSFLYVVGGVM